MEHVEIELIDKEKVLKENIKDIAQLDEAILLIEHQQHAITAEKEKFEGDIMKSLQIDEKCITTTNNADIGTDSSGCKTKIYDKFTHKDDISGRESANGKCTMRIQIIAQIFNLIFLNSFLLVVIKKMCESSDSLGCMYDDNSLPEYSGAKSANYEKLRTEQL